MGWFDWIYKNDSARITLFKAEIDKQKKQVDDLNTYIINQDNKIKNLEMEKINIQTERDNLQKQLDDIEVEEELESYWNNKRPKAGDYSYGARPPLGSLDNVKVDPRIFFMNKDKVPIVTGKDNDSIAKLSLQRVIDIVTYTPDMTQFKDDEVWMFPFEVIKLRKGDCEDGAILLANMLIASGVPYWRVRLNAGDVQGGGHCWCTYLREIDNEWVILDWCYWPDESKNLNNLYSNADKYYNIWFSFNKKFIYLDEQFARTKVIAIKNKKTGGIKNGKNKAKN